MEKLIHGEAARILSVLDESLFHFELLSHLPERENLESLAAEFEASRCRPVVDSLRSLRSAEKRYLKASRGNSKDQIDTATKVLHDATRQVCRSIRNEGRGTETLMNWSHTFKNQRFEEQEDEDWESKESKEGKEEKQAVEELTLEDFLQVLNSFKSVMVEQLLTTVEQTQAKKDFYHETKQRIKQQEEELETIKNALDVEAERERELEKKQGTITRLMAAIKEVGNAYEKDMAEVESQKSKTSGGIHSEHSDAQAKTLEKFDKAAEAFMQECYEHQDTEENLRKRVSRAINELNEVITRYDRDMSTKQRELDRIRQLHQREGERLAVLEEHFRRIDRDLANEAEENRLIAEEQARIDAILKHEHDSAARIQALFRGVQARRNIRKKKGKAKGKKGSSKSKAKAKKK